MSKKNEKPEEPKVVDPSEAEELKDEALEAVAGGCQMGCSNEKTCMDSVTLVDFKPLWQLQDN